MKTLPVLTWLLVLGASLSASANSLMFDFGNPVANTSVPETNAAATPGPVATGTYLTLSPGHATGDVTPAETTWNTITTSSLQSSLSYSDGTSAAGVTLAMGQESAVGSNTIDYATPISNLALIGTGGGTANRKSLLLPGSIYGDSRLGSSAVGRDAFFGGTGLAIGFRIDGLAAGNYKIYLMGRNTNSNNSPLQGMTFYATTGASSGTFTGFNSVPSAFQANTTYSTAEYTHQYESFAVGQNYAVLTISVAANNSVFVAVDGTDTEVRGFINMMQITPATGGATPFVWSKGDGDWDTTSLNWNANAAAYAEPALVTFPNLAEPGDGINTVNLTANRSPLSLTVTNTGNFNTNAYAFTGSGGITGSTGITKNSAGIARFSNANNSYSGTLAINAGAVIKDVADSTTGEITVANDATFALSGGITDGSGQTITISGPGNVNLGYFYAGSFNQRGSLQSQAGNNTWAGNIVLAGAPGTGGTTRIGVQSGSSLTLTGTISEAVAGMSPYFRAGDSSADVITIAGTCSWTGPTRIFSNGGIVTISANDKLPTAADLIVGTSASTLGSPTFDLAGFNQTVAGLGGVAGTSPPIIRNSGGNQSTLTLNPSAPGTYAGSVQENVKLVIGGTASQTLAGDNTHAGDTTINTGGDLIISDTGELQFYPADNGVTNSVGGTGLLQFDGILRIDLINAAFTAGNSWTLVNRTSLAGVSFGSTFAVIGSGNDFTETALDSGIWKLVDGPLVWTFTESTGKLTLGSDVADPFANWIATFFPGVTNPAIVGKGADPDGDGTNNLAEFALNGTPNNGSKSGYHTIAIEDTDADTQKELTLTIAVRKTGGSPVFAGSPLSATVDGVKYTIEGSLDLVFPASAASEASPATGPGGLSADYEYRRFRLDASEGLAGKGFLRVKTAPTP